VTKLVNFKKS